MINIGIIGPTWTNDRIKRSMNKFPNFNPIYKTSNSIYDAPQLTKELVGKCDVLLYSGFVPYSISKEQIPNHIPAHFVPIKGASLYRSFYKLKSRLNKFKKISMDTLSQYEIDSLNRELNESVTCVLYDSKLSLKKHEEVIAFHETAYNEKNTDCALTALKIVSEALTEKNIPNEWITPTEEDIIVTLERALLATEQRKKLESQIVFGIIQIDNFDQLKQQFTSEHKIQRLYLDIQKSILDFVEVMEGYLTVLNGNEYVFVTTRGTFERVTQGYKYFPLIDDMKIEQNLLISVGIGFGLSAYESGSHARMALTQAIDFGGESCFIVREDLSVIGPIAKEGPLVYPLNITDAKLLELTKNTKISPYYLRKVISLLQSKHIDTFTAQELATSLGVTTRSANRILLIWSDAKIVEIKGIEKQHSKGRPRQVYKMLIKGW